jgi:hypothetical protein
MAGAFSASKSLGRQAEQAQQYIGQGYSFGGLGGPQPLPTTQLAINQGKQQLDLQKMITERLFGGGGFLDSLLGGFSGGGGGIGFPDTGIAQPGFADLPGVPGYGGEGRPPVGAPAPGLGMPITQHGGGGVSAVPGMQPFGQGRRDQLTEDFNNLAKSAQTMLVQRGFGGSSAVPDTFAEIGKQKTLSMNELNDSLFREQLQFRAAERAPLFSILQSLMGGVFG